MRKKFNNLIIVNNPLIKRDISILRDKNTNTGVFREAVKRISIVLAVEIAKDFKIRKINIETPLEKTDGYEIVDEIVLVPVLRAGLGMVSGFLSVLTDSKMGHILLQRDEKTLKPIEYYYKTPKNINNSKVILLDPMLATGGSASESISYLKKRGAINCIFACLVSSPEGVEKMNNEHKDVKIFTAVLDRQLNNKGYILPGLGDAGDRTFGTF